MASLSCIRKSSKPWQGGKSMLDTVKKVRTSAPAMLCVSIDNAISSMGIQNTHMVLIAYTGLTIPTTESFSPVCSQWTWPGHVSALERERESSSVICSFTSLEADSPPPSTPPFHNQGHRVICPQHCDSLGPRCLLEGGSHSCSIWGQSKSSSYVRGLITGTQRVSWGPRWMRPLDSEHL